ncbi:MAG: S-adenosylhomocysteine/5'-methylthioadenosine nucleosidase [Anaerolineaceae bacterium]|nr:MAG: S-adenosylhomocysteine/5'-methylthioadenosine nucleosidase [Anaerolineaceae bacterium]
METIGLIAAMTSESGALLRYIKGWKRAKFGTFRGIRFQLMDRDCFLVTSGMGLTRAADAARALLAETNPRLLVSFGIAGAVNADLEIGDVIIAGKICLLENGLPGKFQPLAILSDAAWGAAARSLQADGTRLLPGTAVTTRGSQVILKQSDEMPNPILEMETAGIAQVAAEAGIPLVSIRSISDGPRSPIPLDLEAVMDENYNFRIGRLIAEVFRHPDITLRSREMMQNSRKAADHAAKALVAVLGFQSPIIT